MGKLSKSRCKCHGMVMVLKRSIRSLHICVCISMISSILGLGFSNLHILRNFVVYLIIVLIGFHCLVIFMY